MGKAVNFFKAVLIPYIISQKIGFFGALFRKITPLYPKFIFFMYDTILTCLKFYELLKLFKISFSLIF